MTDDAPLPFTETGTVEDDSASRSSKDPAHADLDRTRAEPGGPFNGGQETATTNTLPDLIERNEESGAPRTVTATDPPEQHTAETEPTGPGTTAVERKDARAGAVFFLTNRMNLNGILSSRMVCPRESFHKYYADLLERTPGWVPLLTTTPTAELIAVVTVERGSGPAVIVEFPATVVPARARKAPVAYVPAVALADATAIHFEDERDLREHRARGYANIHPHDELLRVTPSLFAASGGRETTLDAPSEPHVVDWRKIDRVRGAINAAVVAASTGEQLVIAGSFLGADKLPTAVKVPEWIGWRAISDGERPQAPPPVAHAPTESEPSRLIDHSDESGGSNPGDAIINGTVDPNSEKSTVLPDRAGFATAYHALGERDVSEEWSPNAVLDAVEADLRAADSLPADAVEALIRNLRRVRSIVNVEVDFEPFRPTAQALVSAKGLLLVLLRQDLAQLLAWPQEETGADDATRIVAAVLAGRLRGLARESTDQRILPLDDLTARWAVRIITNDGAHLERVHVAATGRGTTLKVAGTVIAQLDPLLPDLVAKYRKIAKGERDELRIKVSRLLGWPITYGLQLPADAVVEQDASRFTVTSISALSLNATVDEDMFLDRLGSLTGSARIQASKAFPAR